MVLEYNIWEFTEDWAPLWWRGVEFHYSDNKEESLPGMYDTINNIHYITARYRDDDGDGDGISTFQFDAHMLDDYGFEVLGLKMPRPLLQTDVADAVKQDLYEKFREHLATIILDSPVEMSPVTDPVDSPIEMPPVTDPVDSPVEERPVASAASLPVTVEDFAAARRALQNSLHADRLAGGSKRRRRLSKRRRRVSKRKVSKRRVSKRKVSKRRVSKRKVSKRKKNKKTRRRRR